MALISAQHQILNTDLYQLTMAAGYHLHGLSQQLASFELYVRRLPAQRSFLVAAGLQQAIEYLQNLSFSQNEVEILRQLPVFAHLPESFFAALLKLRFSGDLWALPEGTVFYPYEPVIRITAPLIQAQLVETWLLAMLNYQISVASKAARIQVVLQNLAPEARFIDFGSRRAHGPEASLLAARAAWIGGALGTSNVLAAHELGIPVHGTAAHAWTMAFEDEPSAFAAYRQSFPDSSTLLVDTYDTLQGVRHAIESGPGLKAIRLDSGDFLELSRQARQMLDAAGMQQTRIVVSGDMNEYKIQALLRAGAPIDVFGVGTELVTSLDAPSLGGVYKLVEIQRPDGELRHCLKLSGSKISYPGRKQIWRSYDADGLMQRDDLGLEQESLQGEALLQRFMQSGQLCQNLPDLAGIQAHTRSQLRALPLPLQQLEAKESLKVEISPQLNALYQGLKDKISAKEFAQ